MICPSCLMFDSHKGHSVCRIEEGAKDVRNKINSSAKDGLLKFDRTQNVMLDIRHARLSLTENMATTMQAIQKHFDELIAILKVRKNKFIQQILKHFETQIELIDECQQKWLRKQQVSQKILQLQTSTDDIKLMDEAKYIVDGLEALNQPPSNIELRLLNGLQTDTQVGKHNCKLQDLRDSLSNILKRGPIIINRIRC